MIVLTWYCRFHLHVNHRPINQQNSCDFLAQFYFHWGKLISQHTNPQGMELPLAYASRVVINTGLVKIHMNIFSRNFNVSREIVCFTSVIFHGPREAWVDHACGYIYMSLIHFTVCVI